MANIDRRTPSRKSRPGSSRRSDRSKRSTRRSMKTNRSPRSTSPSRRSWPKMRTSRGSNPSPNRSGGCDGGKKAFESRRRKPPQPRRTPHRRLTTRRPNHLANLAKQLKRSRRCLPKTRRIRLAVETAPIQPERAAMAPVEGTNGTTGRVGDACIGRPRRRRGRPVGHSMPYPLRSRSGPRQLEEPTEADPAPSPRSWFRIDARQLGLASAEPRHSRPSSLRPQRTFHSKARRPNVTETSPIQSPPISKRRRVRLSRPGRYCRKPDRVRPCGRRKARPAPRTRTRPLNLTPKNTKQRRSTPKPTQNLKSSNSRPSPLPTRSRQKMKNGVDFPPNRRRSKRSICRSRKSNRSPRSMSPSRRDYPRRAHVVDPVHHRTDRADATRGNEASRSADRTTAPRWTPQRRFTRRRPNHLANIAKPRQRPRRFLRMRLPTLPLSKRRTCGSSRPRRRRGGTNGTPARGRRSPAP